MSIVNGYATLSDLKRRLDIEDSDDDQQLEKVIEGVSRGIDAITRRRFFAATETRHYTARNARWLLVDDILSVSANGLKTDTDGDRTYETTWATTDFDLEPFNAALDGEPFTRILVAPNGSKLFPTGIRKGVQVAGSFGYSALTSLPAEVNEACLLLSEKLWQRKDSPYGILGAAQLGQITILARAMGHKDPDITPLLMGVMRVRVGVA